MGHSEIRNNKTALHVKAHCITSYKIVQIEMLSRLLTACIILKQSTFNELAIHAKLQYIRYQKTILMCSYLAE